MLRRRVEENTRNGAVWDKGERERERVKILRVGSYCVGLAGVSKACGRRWGREPPLMMLWEVGRTGEKKGRRRR
jgi:hypothetical protein